MKYEIELPAGEPFIDFDLLIGDYFFRIELRWNLNGGFYMVNIYENEKELVSGKGLHPQVDLLKNQNLDAGRLYLEGETPTIDNLGKENRLIHEI